MFVPKDDRLRHRIMQILLQRHIAAEKPDSEFVHVNESCITTEELAKMLNVTPAKIRAVTSSIQVVEEIKYDNFGEGEVLYLWRHGATAVHDKKYLRQGRKRVNENIYDFTKWFVPLSLAFITIYTTVILTKENRESKRQISNLQSKVDSIKANPNQIFQPIIYLDSLSLRRVYRNPE